MSYSREGRSIEKRLERLEYLVERLYALVGDRADDLEPLLDAEPEPAESPGDRAGAGAAPEGSADSPGDVAGRTPGKPAPAPAPDAPEPSRPEPARQRDPAHQPEPAAAGAPAAPLYSGVPVAARTPDGIPRPPKRSFDLTDLGENWISRVGVGLFLLGLGFAFKYAFDQGWVTPWLRVAIGVQLGALFLVVGLRLHQRRPLYSQVLLGGAIGTFYLSGWAAFQLYGLVGHGVAFSWMAAVTVLALALAELKDQSVLAAIGAFGGLATPFVLSTGVARVPELVAYTTLLLGWTGVIYLRRGWLGLLGVVSLGGLVVMAVAAAAASGGERWIAQLGVTMAWVVAGVLPFVRQRLRLADPERWPAPRIRFREDRGPGAEADAGDYDATMRIYLVMAGIVAGLVGGVVTAFLWEMDALEVGFVFHAEALVLAAVAWWAFGQKALLASPAVEVAAVLLVVGTVVFSFDDTAAWLTPGMIAPGWLYLALAVEAVLFLSLRREFALSGVAWVAHLVFVSLALGFMVELSAALDGSAPFDMPVPFRLMAVGAALGAGFLAVSATAQTVYRVGAHFAFVAWIAAVLHPVTNGLSWTVLAWGVYGAALLAVHRELGWKGLATLAHILFAMVAFGLVYQTFPLFDPDTLSVGIVHPAVLLLLTLATALGAAFLVDDEDVRNPYLLATHVIFLLWLAAVLYPIQDAVSWITLAWGAHGIVLLALSIRLEHRGLRATAFGTLALVVGKLILVDTAQVEMIWRVLLFMGFGAAFLALGYFLRSDEEPPVPDVPEADGPGTAEPGVAAAEGGP